jgi:hypothetical protein
MAAWTRPVICRQPQTDAHFRRGAGDREPLAAAGDAGEHVHYQPLKRVGIGSITSTKKTGGCTCFELLAFELGCTVTTAKRLWKEGLI